MVKKIHSEGQSLIVSSDVDVDNLDVDNMIHKPGLADLINEFKKNKLAKQVNSPVSDTDKLLNELDNDEVELHLNFGNKKIKFEALLDTISLEESSVRYSFGMLIKDAIALNNLYLSATSNKKNKGIFLSKLTFGGFEKENNKQKTDLFVKRIFINKNYDRSLIGIALVEIDFASKDFE